MGIFYQTRKVGIHTSAVSNNILTKKNLYLCMKEPYWHTLFLKVIHPKYYKHLKEAAELFGQKKFAGFWQKGL